MAVAQSSQESGLEEHIQHTVMNLVGAISDYFIYSSVSADKLSRKRSCGYPLPDFSLTAILQQDNLILPGDYVGIFGFRERYRLFQRKKNNSHYKRYGVSIARLPVEDTFTLGHRFIARLPRIYDYLVYFGQLKPKIHPGNVWFHALFYDHVLEEGSITLNDRKTSFDFNQELVHFTFDEEKKK